jgi:hypothetical protein
MHELAIVDSKDNFGVNVSSGVYVYRFQAQTDNSSYDKTMKMVLMR